MEITARQLGATKVRNLDGKFLCRLRSAIIEPTNGQVLGFTSSRLGANIISPHDICSWDKKTMVLGNNYEFHHPSEIIRLERLLKEGNHHLIGKKVRTEAGQKIGKVTDFSINQHLKVLSSITTHKTFFFFFHFDKRLIHQKNILEIKPKEIIVKGSAIKIPLTNPVQSTPDKFSLQNSPTFDRA